MNLNTKGWILHFWVLGFSWVLTTRVIIIQKKKKKNDKGNDNVHRESRNVLCCVCSVVPRGPFGKVLCLGV